MLEWKKLEAIASIIQNQLGRSAAQHGERNSFLLPPIWLFEIPLGPLQAKVRRANYDSLFYMESKVNTQRLICFKVTGCEIESTLIAHDLFISSVLDLYRLTYMYFQLSDCTCSLYEQLLVSLLIIHDPIKIAFFEGELSQLSYFSTLFFWRTVGPSPMCEAYCGGYAKGAGMKLVVDSKKSHARSLTSTSTPFSPVSFPEDLEPGAGRTTEPRASLFW